VSGEAEARTGSPETPAEPWTARELATLKRFSKRAVAGATGIGVIVGLASALLTMLFVVLPNLKPSTTNLVAITNVVVEPNVTFGQYLQHPSTAMALGAQGMSLDDIRGRSKGGLADRGAGVDFQFEVRGYGGALLQARWTLFDGSTGERLAESEQMDPLPLKFVAQKKEADIGTWEFWVRAFDQGRKSYFVRIEMYDLTAGTRLTFKDSEKFSPSP
jgi:hypothetical protein